MKYSFTFFLSILALLGFSQPTLTGVDLNGSIGDTFRVVNCEHTAAGNAGANQTWDFSNLDTKGSHQLSYVDAKTTNHASDFPTSNIAWSNLGNISYLKQDAKTHTLQGVVAGGLLIKYTDPEDFLRYPVKYNDSYVDTWGATFTNGITFIRKGKTTVKVDGYGTITTPAGTYTNAVRVHMLQEYSDSSTFAVINYENDQYMWYVKDIAYPVLTSYEFTSSQGSTSATLYVTTKQVIGISRAETRAAFKLYPNPASSHLQVVMANAHHENVNWEMVDLAGKAHLSGRSMSNLEGQFSLNVSSLPKGMYYLKVRTNTGVSSSALVID